MSQQWTTIEAMSADSNPVVAMEGRVEADSLGDFLAAVERRAFRMAQVAVGDRDAALDIVQDAMMKLVQHYAAKPASEWRPLFFRILNNSIHDWHRRQRSRWMLFDRWFGSDHEAEEDALEALPDGRRHQPEQLLSAQRTLADIETAVRRLSARQQQAFMLRCWEGLSTQEAATAMECSEGTVKTLYSRALSALREALGDDYAG